MRVGADPRKPFSFELVDVEIFKMPRMMIMIINLPHFAAPTPMGDSEDTGQAHEDLVCPVVELAASAGPRLLSVDSSSARIAREKLTGVSAQCDSSLWSTFYRFLPTCDEV